METKRDVRHISNVGSGRLIHSSVSLTLVSIIVIIIKRGNGWKNTCISHPEELEDNDNTLPGEERLRDEKTGTTAVTFWPTVYRMYAASRYKPKQLDSWNGYACVLHYGVQLYWSRIL